MNLKKVGRETNGLRGICEYCHTIVLYESFDSEWCPSYESGMPENRKFCLPEYFLTASEIKFVIAHPEYKRSVIDSSNVNQLVGKLEQDPGLIDELLLELED